MITIGCIMLALVIMFFVGSMLMVLGPTILVIVGLPILDFFVIRWVIRKVKSRKEKKGD